MFMCLTKESISFAQETIIRSGHLSKAAHAGPGQSLYKCLLPKGRDEREKHPLKAPTLMTHLI